MDVLKSFPLHADFHFLAKLGKQTEGVDDKGAEEGERQVVGKRLGVVGCREAWIS